MNEIEEKPEFFVSRRGRQVGVHEVDLKNIDIESNEPLPPVKPTKKSASKKSKTSRKRSGWTKSKRIIIAVVLLLLLIPLALGELVAAQYRAGVPSAKADLTKLVNNTVLPLQKKPTISADQTRDVANSVDDIASHMCRGGLLDNMASVYLRAKDEFNACKAAQRQYAALATNLYALEAQARYLEKLDVFVKPISTPITDDYAVLGAQQTAWQTAADGIKKLVPPDAMKTAHSDLSKHVTAASDAWSKLNTANNAQNAIDFNAAEKTLATEYEAVRSTSSLFTDVIKTTQATITLSYNSIK